MTNHYLRVKLNWCQDPKSTIHVATSMQMGFNILPYYYMYLQKFRLDLSAQIKVKTILIVSKNEKAKYVFFCERISSLKLLKPFLWDILYSAHVQ